MASGAGRSISCRDETEYAHRSICCLKCEAGRYVKNPCTEAGKKGTCEECDDGTFTEHANGLKQCIKCAQCPPGNCEVVHSHPGYGVSVQAGRYCHPDEACETCTKCSRCGSDEVIVKNCTSTSNTECKKVQPKSASDADNGLTVGLCITFAVILVVVSIFIIIWRQKCRGAVSDSLKQEYVPVDDNGTGLTHRSSLVMPKMKGRINLCESNTSSASSSQHNLTEPLCSAPAASLSWDDPSRREEEPFPSLVPVEGVESLKKCFDFF